MAKITGTVNQVFGFTSPLGPKRDSSSNAVVCCYVNASFAGTYAQADDAQLTTVGATIAAAAKDGKTYNVLSAAMAAPGDEAGTPIGVGPCTVSSNTISFQLTGGDLSTEHTGAALGTLNNDVCLFVCCTVS